MSKTALRLQNKKPKQHLQKKYKVKVSLSYTGVVEVEAQSKADAIHFVNGGLGEPDEIKFQTDNADISNSNYFGEMELQINPKEKRIY